jgi:hypothetical protein
LTGTQVELVYSPDWSLGFQFPVCTMGGKQERTFFYSLLLSLLFVINVEKIKIAHLPIFLENWCDE